MPSPPKPWEVNNGTAAAATAAVPNAITTPTAAASATTLGSDFADAPPVPTRSTASTALNQPGSYGSGFGGTTGYGTSGYGTTGYGGYGNSYGNSYGSGYGSSSYGGYGGYNRYGSSYGGYGGIGSSYGGYGGMGGMGGYGSRYGGGMMSPYGNRMGGPEGEIPLTQRMEAGTRPAFEVIEQIVGAFGGFAQMLDSTFMATHSSFMAMVGMAEQLGFLRSYLGQVFSVFALYRLIKKYINKALGRVEPGRPSEMNFSDFQQFESKAAQRPKISKKPILIFLFMVVGLPYLMHKLIQLITAKQRLEQKNNPQSNDPMMASMGKIDPAKLEFARATYDFTAESQMELSLKKGDIVAILSKSDPVSNQQSQWWRGRLRDGRMGMFPANYVEIVQKAGAADAVLDETQTPIPSPASE